MLYFLYLFFCWWGLRLITQFGIVIKGLQHENPQQSSPHEPLNSILSQGSFSEPELFLVFSQMFHERMFESVLCNHYLRKKKKPYWLCCQPSPIYEQLLPRLSTCDTQGLVGNSISIIVNDENVWLGAYPFSCLSF